MTDTARREIDLIDGSLYGGDPFPTFAWMRQNAPAYFDEQHGVWGISRYEDVKWIGKEPDLFSSAGGIRPEYPALPYMIDMDAPEHVRRRRLINGGFTPRKVAEAEAGIRKTCDDIIDAACEAGSCDFVNDIAAPLPMIVIGDMMGVAPEHRGDLLRWSDDMLKALGSPDPEAMDRAGEAFVGWSAYISDSLEARRRTGDDSDLIGTLVHAEIDGDRLDDHTLIYELLLILIGGDETTRHVISGGMEALLASPDQFEALREDRSLLPAAVEEMLRWVSPIKNMARTAVSDTELHGQVITEGQKVLLLYPSANRDETVFENPETFDIRRSPNDHVAFGFGAHFCLGNRLARVELNTMFDRLLDRLPDLRRSGDGPLPRRDANFVSGLEAMPVEFTPTARLGA